MNRLSSAAAPVDTKSGEAKCGGFRHAWAVLRAALAGVPGAFHAVARALVRPTRVGREGLRFFRVGNEQYQQADCRGAAAAFTKSFHNLQIRLDPVELVSVFGAEEEREDADYYYVERGKKAGYERLIVRAHGTVVPVDPQDPAQIHLIDQGGSVLANSRTIRVWLGRPYAKKDLFSGVLEAKGQNGDAAGLVMTLYVTNWLLHRIQRKLERSVTPLVELTVQVELFSNEPSATHYLLEQGRTARVRFSGLRFTSRFASH